MARRHAKPAAPALPAHEIVLAALDRLGATDFTDRAALRRAYFELSEVVRVYVEARFGLNATDLTSEEIVRRMPAIPALGPAAGERLRRFLGDTDRVKFAAHLPGEGEIRETLRGAHAFVDATRSGEATEAAA